MLEYKQSVAARVPVRLLTSAGVAVTGKVFGDVTATIEKSDGTTTTLTLAAPDWVEITAGAFASTGMYNLIIPTSATNLSGVLAYAISVSGAEKYIGIVKVVANEESDTKAVVDSIQTTANTTSTNVSAVQSTVTDLKDIGLGKWEIVVSGVDTNRLILYRQDGVTVLKKFDLKDGAGDATFINPFKRIPV